MSAVCGPHLQTSAEEEVDQTSAVCKKKTVLAAAREEDGGVTAAGKGGGGATAAGKGGGGATVAGGWSCPSLKRLTLRSRNIFYTRGGPTVVDLFKCLSQIEYLSVWFDTVEFFIPSIFPKELPTTLVHLKCLQMEGLFFTFKYGLPILLLMIKSSPNLEKLELVMEEADCFATANNNILIKMDRISRLPIGIIETILCFLPIQDAARTSILSREWRYHWLKIPKLAFVEDTFEASTDGAELSVLEQTFDKPSERKVFTKRCKLFNAIYQVLLIHEALIHDFALIMDVDGSCVEIDHIIRHLSKKDTVKILKLDLNGTYKLPLSFFSLHQLTDLYLNDCVLDHHPTFNGFGSLTTLHVELLWACEKMLLRLLSGCPLLKRLTLYCDAATLYDNNDSTIVDLFKCLPVIEHLSLWFYIVMCFVPERLPKELPTPLVHLKYLCMEDMCFSHKYSLPFLVLLIRSSPNLEKLRLEIIGENWLNGYEFGTLIIEDYSDIVLEHLNELEILQFSNGEIEMDLVKLILAKSPVLKKARIFVSDTLGKDEELHISKILLSSPCASPMRKIIV
ncbi:hypothetical protein QVD17_11223 [Tagetes erecta]|uniref:FBD domain-containing protein n=1 Tax=Tagetes erecta TaxID=13708 RepID=A0AAD8KUR0_TARER|nr:hypothetical protein QVD17_11223 [Tagetes erecta]